VSGVLFALFYAFTGVATSWFYRRLVVRSLKDVVLVGLIPTASAALLVYIAVKSTATFSGTERWTMIAIGIMGAAMFAIARFAYRSSFCRVRRARYEPEPGPDPSVAPEAAPLTP
jgi:hypothetical protein